MVMFRFYLMKKQNIYLEKEIEKRHKETIEINKKLNEQAKSLKDVITSYSIHYTKLYEIFDYYLLAYITLTFIK